MGPILIALLEALEAAIDEGEEGVLNAIIAAMREAHKEIA